MAYDVTLAQRALAMLGNLPGLEEKKMFGDVGYLLHGNMACSVHGNQLIVRLAPSDYEKALTRPHF